MNRRFIKGEGVVIGRRDWGEADRLLTLFTDEYGKVRFVAKGVRRLKSRKRGHIENFSKLQFSAVQTKGMPILTEVDLLVNYDKVRKNLKKVSVAYYFCEVIDKVAREEEVNAELYDLLVDYFGKLEEEGELRNLRKGFVTKVLRILGFWPMEDYLDDPDSYLEEVTERDMKSVRVGKKMLG